MLQMNDKSGNNSCKLPRQIFNFEAFLHIVKSLQQKDPKNQQKTHANQLISGNLCSLPLVWSSGMRDDFVNRAAIQL